MKSCMWPQLLMKQAVTKMHLWGRKRTTTAVVRAAVSYLVHHASPRWKRSQRAVVYHPASLETKWHKEHIHGTYCMYHTLEKERKEEKKTQRRLKKQNWKKGKKQSKRTRKKRSKRALLARIESRGQGCCLLVRLVLWYARLMGWRWGRHKKTRRNAWR